MASSAHCYLVFDTLVAHYEKRRPVSLKQYRAVVKDTDETVTNLEDDAACSLFVTFNTRRPGKESRLRGCIGTFTPDPLEDNLKHYALISALQDRRFQPIRQAELETLEAAVSILTRFEEIDDPYDWTIGKHGLQVHFVYKNRGRSATFLPDVALEQGWSQEDTLEHLFRKGGWDGAGSWTELQIDLERYQSTKASVSYSDYLDAHKQISGSL